jgi:N-acetylglucosamine kinase-like BadF-type ATPase
MTSRREKLALGIDAGGTRTRWVLMTRGEKMLAEGEVRGLSALQVRESERAKLKKALAELSVEVLTHARPDRAHAALTGFSSASPIRELIAEPLGISVDAITVSSDIEATYLDLFRPDEGYVVYAGTGSVAAFIDADGGLHRAGGRGVALDDGGGGYWIAREALRHIWRREDERPGSWQASPLAREVFQLVGGPDWTHSRQYVYGGDRGDIGRLALAVAKAADADAEARAILVSAGQELARLGNALVRRYGPRPIALTGRAIELHPLIADAVRIALPADIKLTVRGARGHYAAARLALAALEATRP